VREALAMLRDEGPITPIAGCTDVFVGLHFGTLKARRYLDLWPLEDLAEIRLEGGMLRIGARATWTQVRRSALVRRRIPILADAASRIGGIQVQNRGTIGGNVGNASPAGDGLPVLAVAEAVVVLGSAAATRRVPFTEFGTGYRTTAMRPDELILAIEVPPVPGRQWFRKVGTRAAQAVSKVVIAGVLDDTPRIAVGSVADRVIRLPRTEAALAAGVPIAEAQRILASEIEPIDDVRSTAGHRRRVCSNLLARFWSEAGGRG
jgi:CO/xanthine dehydrogenase FAD-binding subunit